MFDQRAGAPDQPPAPVGMRELMPQPPTRPGPVPGPAVPAGPTVQMGPVPVGPAGYTPPSPADADATVVAREDSVEGTFASRGTMRVLGRVKGRIEAARLRIEDGARVEADVVVDEAVIAGEFVGNLTCRQRLEAHASGRLSGHLETYRLMLHEGARIEGEVHMLPEATPEVAAEAAREPAHPEPLATDTVRGSGPIRGAASPPAETGEDRPAPASPPGPAPRSAARSGPVTSTESVRFGSESTPLGNGSRSGR